jgi:hypothetical protein
VRGGALAAEASNVAGSWRKDGVPPPVVPLPMQLGMHLQELWRSRLAACACLVLATLGALSAAYHVSFLPPGLSTRSLDIASASTRVLVDTPSSTALDLKESTTDFEAMSNRAALLGNVMASAPVRGYIARRAHVLPQQILATAPMTPDFPRPVADAKNQKRTTDLFKSTDELRLNIQANPTVPILDIYAEARTTATAEALANGAVDGLRDYLADVARIEGVGRARQVRLSQLGRAQGGVINQGVRLQAAILAFLVVLAVSATAVVAGARVRRGWRAGAARELDLA